MNKHFLQQGIRLLPEPLRMQLARFALWRRRHGRGILPVLLLLCLTFVSAVLGYGLAQQQQWAAATPQALTVLPELAAAQSVEDTEQSRLQLARELGRLQSEVLALRVLFLRLAEVAELDGGEFDLDLDFSALQDSLPRRQYDVLGRQSEGRVAEVTGVFPLRNTSDFSWLVEDSDSEPDKLIAGPIRLADSNELGSIQSLQPSWLTSSHEQPIVVVEPAPIAESVVLVKQALDHISGQATKLASVFRERRMAYDFRVSGKPANNVHITSNFGYRINPLSGRRQLHKGLDLGGKPGSRVMALADGVVTYSGKNGGYGNFVEIEHTNGYRTRYAHNNSLLVPFGARVRKGQAIATMGSTGRSTGTHLHVEILHKGRPLDPQRYIR